MCLERELGEGGEQYHARPLRQPMTTIVALFRIVLFRIVLFRFCLAQQVSQICYQLAEITSLFHLHTLVPTCHLARAFSWITRLLPVSYQSLTRLSLRSITRAAVDNARFPTSCRTFLAARLCHTRFSAIVRCALEQHANNTWRKGRRPVFWFVQGGDLVQVRYSTKCMLVFPRR